MIATGGGAFVDPRTRKLLNERAITVWLDAPVDILAERTSRRDTRRAASQRRSQSDAGAIVRRAPAVLRGSAHPREKRRRRAQGRGRCDHPRARRLCRRRPAPAERAWPVRHRAASDSALNARSLPACRSPVALCRSSRSQSRIRYSRVDPVDLGVVRPRSPSAPPGPSRPRFRTIRAGQRRDRARRARSCARGRMRGPSRRPAGRRRAPRLTALPGSARRPHCRCRRRSTSRRLRARRCAAGRCAVPSP